MLLTILHCPGIPHDQLFSEGPNVIIVPPTLVIQWHDEIRRWVDKGTVDVFPYLGAYDTATRERWWNTVYSQSKLPEYRRIIIVPSSVSIWD